MTTNWRRELPSLLLLAVMLSYFVWRTDPDKVPPAGTLPGSDG